ncbi:MAG: tetratricopeptide repeat protein [Acidobacteriaceae bacterium]|nr:tetratricopeptide repeat protein [Acidobacteriaceae bacterium]
MQFIRTDRHFVTLSVALLFGLQAGPLIAQKAPGGTGTGAGSVGGAGSRGTTGSIPGTGMGTSTGGLNAPGYNRPIFLSGRVQFDDGSELNPNIRIERVCGGSARLEAHTDGKGRFSFQVGNNQAMDTDASDEMPGSSRNPMTNGGANSGVYSSGIGRGAGMNPLWNCELRAAYPGYVSDSIDLANWHTMDNPDVGIIVLHRLANVKGSTISLTTAEAPKKAQKNYEKGLQFAQKGDLEQGEKHLQAAVDLYPKYAVAWYALGQIEERQNRLDDARKSYLAAVAADNKYVSPYSRLALIAASRAKWQDAVDYSKQVIDLNPIEFPSAFWYSAIAYYNLHDLDQAQKSAVALVKLDTAHKYPEAERMLAEISLQKDNYAEAANHLRAYLQLNPTAKDADALKQTLLKIDQASAEVKK